MSLQKFLATHKRTAIIPPFPDSTHYVEYTPLDISASGPDRQEGRLLLALLTLVNVVAAVLNALLIMGQYRN